MKKLNQIAFFASYYLVEFVFLIAQGLAHASNMENLREEVQRICSGTSDRFVEEPYRKSVQADILIEMRRFNNVVMRKELWRDNKKKINRI